MKVNCQVLCVIAALTCAIAQQPPISDFILEQNVAIPMRDGVLLRADILRPKGGGPFPVLVYRTPYGKHFAQKEYTIFRRAVQRGYAVVIQDVRGRYASDGEFRPYENEGRDGYDTIEWAAKQSWSNGNVGTFGLSYPGAVQWLAAVESPPHLKAMVPAMTFSTPQNFFYASGTWDMSWIEWIWDNIAPDVRARKGLPGAKTAEEAIAAWKLAAPEMLKTLPLKQLEDLRGVAPYYYDWLSHPAEDPWWDWAELRNKYRRVHAAVLNFSGWYDDNYGPEGATTNFNGLLKSRANDGEKRTHLLLGPWVHGVDATAKTTSGEREFGPAAAIDYDEVVLRWMDRYLRGTANGIDKGKPVRYFVMGDNTWRDADSWPPPATPVEYYLNAPPAGSNRGTISRDRPAPHQVTSFISDPGNPVLNAYDSSGAHDYDLWVRLLDLAPDGTAFNLMSPGLDVQRASYREMKRGRQLLRPGKIYELGPASLLASNVFQKGHRLRLQISGSLFPNFSRNLQSGELENDSARLQKATISIYSDRRHPSRIVLPLMPQLQ